MSPTMLRNARGSCAVFTAALLMLVTLAFAPARADDQNANDVEPPCGLAGGTLTTVLTPDNDSDFAAFDLVDAQGNEVAKQFIPVSSPSATAEVMITPIGFGEPVTSAKCLADSPVRKCTDPKWSTEEGLVVSLAGLVLGPDYVIVSVGARYKRLSSTAQLAIDGGMAGFQIDKTPMRWSEFFNSEQYVTQAFFNVTGGNHTLTLGTRDPDSNEFVPQERYCFTN